MSLRIVKSVSLDHKTASIADSMDNHSAFVRECLLRYHATLIRPKCTTAPEHVVGGLCIPSKGICLQCWPNGKPDYDDWKSYNRSIKFLVDEDEDYPELHKQAREWIQEKAKENNPSLIDLTDIPTSGRAKAQPRSDPGSFIGRMLKKLRF
jgi:hypothetical protein